jgi:hypothetical protein
MPRRIAPEYHQNTRSPVKYTKLIQSASLLCIQVPGAAREGPLQLLLAGYINLSSYNPHYEVRHSHLITKSKMVVLPEHRPCPSLAVLRGENREARKLDPAPPQLRAKRYQTVKTGKETWLVNYVCVLSARPGENA